MTMRMRFTLAATIVLLTLANGAAIRADQSVGVTTLAISSPERARELTLTLWYPALPGGTPALIGDNAVFEGAAAQQDAPVAAGAFPTVLVSHGGLRAAPNLSGWIARRLAERGFLVVAVQGPKLGPKDARKAVAEIWERPADLSAALTALAGSADWSKRVDQQRVAALGFFLGGTAALSLAGGRLDAESFKLACKDEPRSVDCGWFEASGVDLGSIDAEVLARSNHDPRIATAISVDPEYSSSFARESLAAIAVPVAVINLGRPGSIPPAFDAAKLGPASPRITYAPLPGATRFSAFSLCKPKGAAILAEDGGDDAICSGETAKERADVHDELAALIAVYLRDKLRIAP
jgi:predicted dienelactone hydrolase